LHIGDRFGIDRIEQALRLGPGGLGRIARDDVQANAKANLAPLCGCQALDPFHLGRHRLNRLAPREIDVAVPRRHRAGGG
jgi:hypothetical protein